MVPKMCTFLGVAVLTLAAFHAKSSAAQRICCAGDHWLEFDDGARQRYVEGYILGYTKGHEDGCDDSAKRHDLSSEDCGFSRIEFSKEIEFYSNSLTTFTRATPTLAI
jgi:hypothetical protein